MIIKKTDGYNHTEDLKDILQSVRRYGTRLIPTKCFFGVQEGKFLGFMLSRRDIEVNLDKF